MRCARAHTRRHATCNVTCRTHGERPKPARVGGARQTDRRVAAGSHVARFLAAQCARTPNTTSLDRGASGAASGERLPGSRTPRPEEDVSMRAVRAAVVAAVIFWGAFGAFISAVH